MLVHDETRPVKGILTPRFEVLTNPCLVKEILTPGVKVLDEEVLLLHGVHLGQVTAL